MSWHNISADFVFVSILNENKRKLRNKHILAIPHAKSHTNIDHFEWKNVKKKNIFLSTLDGSCQIFIIHTYIQKKKMKHQPLSSSSMRNNGIPAQQTNLNGETKRNKVHEYNNTANCIWFQDVIRISYYARSPSLVYCIYVYLFDVP